MRLWTSGTPTRSCHRLSPRSMHHSRDAVYLVPFTNAGQSGFPIRIVRVRMSEMEGEVTIETKLHWRSSNNLFHRFWSNNMWMSPGRDQVKLCKGGSPLYLVICVSYVSSHSKLYFVCFCNWPNYYALDLVLHTCCCVWIKGVGRSSQRKCDIILFPTNIFLHESLCVKLKHKTRSVVVPSMIGLLVMHSYKRASSCFPPSLCPSFLPFIPPSSFLAVSLIVLVGQLLSLSSLPWLPRRIRIPLSCLFTIHHPNPSLSSPSWRILSALIISDDIIITSVCLCVCVWELGVIHSYPVSSIPAWVSDPDVLPF